MAAGQKGNQSEKGERVGSGARRALNHAAVCVERDETLTLRLTCELTDRLMDRSTTLH